MAGFEQQQDDEIISSINVTPMVDIILVLLIIFMVTATLIVKPSIIIDLPEAANSEETETTTLSLMLDRKGGLFLDGEKITEKELIKFAAAEKEKDKKIHVIIGADRLVPHGKVIHLIDVVKGVGITKFAINIEPVNLQ